MADALPKAGSRVQVKAIPGNRGLYFPVSAAPALITLQSVGFSMLIKQGERLINTRNWAELVKPDHVFRDSEESSTYGKFVCEPLERGYGNTIGNALRRVLLASLQGAALVSVKIAGSLH